MKSKVDIYKKRIGQLCWISAEKSVLKGFTLLRHGDFTKCSNTCVPRFSLALYCEGENICNADNPSFASLFDTHLTGPGRSVFFYFPRWDWLLKQ